MNRRVVVTGIGVLSPFGLGNEIFWDAIKTGKNAVRPWQPDGSTEFPVSYAAAIDIPLETLIKDHLHSFHLPDYIERRAVFGVIAAENAVNDAGLSLADTKIGVAVCSGVPDFDDASLLALIDNDEDERNNYEKRAQRIARFSGTRCSNDVLSDCIANNVKATAATFNVSGACAGASQALGAGYRAIQRGEAQVMLCGGADSVLNIRTMSALKLLGATAINQRFGSNLCRPFDKDRCGLVAGEGAAILVLEDEEHAKKRQAKIYAEIVGYGSSLDADKITAPHPEGLGAIQAMQAALHSANLATEQIQYINAHGTSTPLNDATETLAIKHLFGEHAHTLRVSSTKSMIGHWIAASGAPEAIATIMALKNQLAPPTINLSKPDTNLDLNYVIDKAQPLAMNYALSNSFGFGGINATLAFGSYNNA